MMSVSNNLLNYLLKEFCEEDCIRLLKENSLYYRLGENIFKFTDTDKMNKKISNVLSQYNFNTLTKIMKEFEKNQIEIISFKGTILSYLLFENVHTRSPGDIDIFTHDLHRALEILIMMGFCLPDRNTELENPHHISLANNRVIVELHKNIFHPSVGINEDYLRRNLSDLKISKYIFRTFNITASLLHLLYHLYMDIYFIDIDFYAVLIKKQLPQASRFLYRAYEIALFSKKFFDEIKWEEIEENLRQQKLRVIFKKMIYDILVISPDVFPESFQETVSQLEYIDDEKDWLNKYLIKSYIIGKKRDIESILSNYIDDNWIIRGEKNIHKRVGEFFNLAKESDNQRLQCAISSEKCTEGLKLCFNVSNDDFCFSDIDNYDTAASDGVHLILCGTQKYSYNSIFFFPKDIDGEIKVISYDVLNNVVLDEELVKADFTKTESGYKITVLLSNNFIEKNHIENYFYMGLVISDCNSETHIRERNLVLSEEESQWYNPIYFAKIDITNC